MRWQIMAHAFSRLFIRGMLVAALLGTTFLLLAVIGRVILQFRQTGNHGIRFANPANEPVAAIAGASFVLSFSMSLLIIALDYVRVWPLERWESVLNIPEVAVAIGFIGIVVILTAQWQMRDSWRIGVDPSEKTKLIKRGLFTNSRNPIYFGIFMYWIGIAGTLPHPVIWCLAIVCCASIEIIVRKVEEPYLRSLHGSDYDRYFERTNRYLIW